MKLLLQTLVSLVITSILLLIAFNLPAEYLNYRTWSGRTTLGGLLLSDITGSTAVSAYPAIQNANNTALETVIDTITGTTTNSTITTLSGLTTATNLVSIGTITSGSWNATAIPVNKGGTGTTSPSTWLILLGNGANGITVASSTGTSGQFFTSNGDGAFPSWTTGTINQASNYNWTGVHNFANVASTSVSTGFYANLIGATYFNATSTTATSTFRGGMKMDYATTTNLTVSGKCFNCATNGYAIVNNTAAGPTSGAATANVTVDCALGKTAITGGASNDSTDRVVLRDSYASDIDTWSVTYTCLDIVCDANTMTAYAICVNP